MWIQFSHRNIWHLSISYHDSSTNEKNDDDAQVVTEIVEIGTERKEVYIDLT